MEWRGVVSGREGRGERGVVRGREGRGRRL